MNGLQALQTLLRHAENERDEARSLMQRAEHQLAAAQAQHQQLLDYRRDSQQRWSEQFGRQGTMEIVHCYQGFVSRLGMAIEQQQHVASRASDMHEAATHQLREKELRVASVGKLIERRLQEAQRSAMQREQKLTDEMASRLAWARLHGSPSHLAHEGA